MVGEYATNVGPKIRNMKKNHDGGFLLPEMGDPDWKKEWIRSGMPEYVQEDLTPFQSIMVHFATPYDRINYMRKLGDRFRVNTNLTSNWHHFPPQEYRRFTDKNAPPSVVEGNKYPIYVISKGIPRAEALLTVRQLEHLGIEYRLVIEPQEEKMYRECYRKWKLDPGDKILVLPKKNYGKGCSIPARNWVWNHSIEAGATSHWILDDNIQGFFEMNHNKKPKIRGFNPFRIVEHFVDQYENVGLSGMNYEFFAQSKTAAPAYQTNTRVYSCILVRNNLKEILDEMWRGRYNEDTDLSLRVLKKGLVTVLFNYVLAKKVPSMVMGGGNTESLYKEDGRLKMAQSLKEQHPDLVTITRKWGRWQHHVDYSGFIQKLKRCQSK